MTHQVNIMGLIMICQLDASSSGGVVYLLARRGQHNMVCGSMAVRRAAGETETLSMQNTAT